jgi:hypothetical protein
MSDEQYNNLDSALRLAAMGWKVFPCTADKRPMTEHGFREGTVKENRIRLWWRVYPDALVGVALSVGTMAVDIDDPALFKGSKLDLPPGLQQKTPRGEHHLYATGGRPLPQTVKAHPGVDTRVGGRGYVIAWEPSAWIAPGELTDAPEWVYEGGDTSQTTAPDDSSRRGRPVEVAIFKIGQRDNQLASFAGSMRRQGAGPEAIYAALKTMLDHGQIEQGRESKDKISDRDLHRIAGSIGKRQSDAVDVQRRPKPKPQSANDLLSLNFDPLVYLVDELLPEGFGIIAGAPKVGKSWLSLQAAVEVAAGGELLGRRCMSQDVLYYALEDGERRCQSRLETISLDYKKRVGRLPNLSRLYLMYEAPHIGSGLEEDVSAWLDDHPGGLVVIDVLAKVRPTSTGKGSVYDEDYSIVGAMQSVSKSKPGCSIAMITHDRKAASEDFLTTVTGSRGIVGVADWIWVIKRDRLQTDGTLYVTGRDIERDSAVGATFEGTWHANTNVVSSGLTDGQLPVWQFLRTDGPCTLAEVTTYFHGDATADPDRVVNETATFKMLRRMLSGGRVEESSGKPHTYAALNDQEYMAKTHTGVSDIIVNRVKNQVSGSKAQSPRVRVRAAAREMPMEGGVWMEGSAPKATFHEPSIEEVQPSIVHEQPYIPSIPSLGVHTRVEARVRAHGDLASRELDEEAPDDGIGAPVRLKRSPSARQRNLT